MSQVTEFILFWHGALIMDVAGEARDLFRGSYPNRYRLARETDATRSVKPSAACHVGTGGQLCGERARSEENNYP